MTSASFKFSLRTVHQHSCPSVANHDSTISAPTPQYATKSSCSEVGPLSSHMDEFEISIGNNNRTPEDQLITYQNIRQANSRIQIDPTCQSWDNCRWMTLDNVALIIQNLICMHFEGQLDIKTSIKHDKERRGTF